MQAPRQGLLPSAPASSGGLHPPSTAASSTASSRKERLEAMLRREVGSKPKPKPNPNPDLLPKLQGRLPIRVSLSPLTESDFVRILNDTEYNLISQQEALLESEGVEP